MSLAYLLGQMAGSSRTCPKNGQIIHSNFRPGKIRNGRKIVIFIQLWPRLFKVSQQVFSSEHIDKPLSHSLLRLVWSSSDLFRPRREPVTYGVSHRFPTRLKKSTQKLIIFVMLARKSQLGQQWKKFVGQTSYFRL